MKETICLSCKNCMVIKVEYFHKPRMLCKFIDMKGTVLSCSEFKKRDKKLEFDGLWE